MMKKILFIGLFGLGSFGSQAQDAHLSMYDAAPIFLNPAMTGVFQGDWRLHAQYRTQWKAVNYKPYTTALISFDAPVKKWGFGAQISNFRAGLGNYNAFNGTVSAAYTTSIDKSKNHNISFGIQGGLTQKSVEHQLLSFNNQYTTNNGGEFNTAVDPSENFAAQSVILPNVNAGFLYFYAKQESRLNPFIGFSAFNLTQPKETFTGIDNRLPMRFYGHAGTRINITETFYLLPKVLYMQQLKFGELTFAVDAGYYLKGSDLYLLAGAIYRNSGTFTVSNADAMVVSIGAKMDSFIAKVGYDVNISSLATVSNGRGGIELSFTYMKQKKKPKTEKICPRL
ncbi:MAG: type IX secretion system PorP/SprF family membrane protein [Crocinitomicaceae bacterium]|jgi:type IX secretion system PorP/SprF family membrane protein